MTSNPNDHDHDDLYDLCARLERRIADLESELSRVADAARDAGYDAQDAKRDASSALSAAQRGW